MAAEFVLADTLREGTDDLLDTLFFRRLGASRLEKTICAVPTTEVAKGMYGKMPTVAFGLP